VGKWTSANRKNKIRSDAKFNTPMLKVAQNLVALGFTEKDLGIVLGCKGDTIKAWKARYPEFFKASKKGKQILKGILVAQMMRAAEGYDYEEETIKFDKYVDSSGKEVVPEDKDTKAIKKQTVTKYTKHQSGNSQLMMFLAQNLLPEMFPRSGLVAEQNILNIIGSVEGDRLRTFAGRLEAMTRKKIESKEIESEDAPTTEE